MLLLLLWLWSCGSGTVDDVWGRATTVARGKQVWPRSSNGNSELFLLFLSLFRAVRLCHFTFTLAWQVQSEDTC